MSDVKPSEVIAWLEKRVAECRESAVSFREQGHRDDYADSCERHAEMHRSYAECIRSLEAREARYRRVLEGLVSAVDATDAASAGTFILAHVQGYSYQGPSHADAMLAARRALTEPTNTQEQET